MSQVSVQDVDHLRHNARSVVRELGLLNDAYFEIGVTLAERHLLIELSRSPSPTMGEIAKQLLLDKSTVSRLISKAEKKGYIELITDEKDRRKRFLKITEKGTQVLNAFEPIAFNQTKNALLTLRAEEIQSVYKGMALYAQGLHNARLKKADETNLVKSPGESLDEIYQRLDQMGYVLDLYQEKDEEGLFQIYQEVVDSGYKFPYENNSLEEFHKQFINPQGKTYVCRSSIGEIVGGFYIKSNCPGRASHIANGAYMIRDTYRGKGIGSLLIKASLHLAKELGFKAMQFNMVVSTNTSAIKLYETLGFTIIGTVPEAFRTPDGRYLNGYIMHRKL